MGGPYNISSDERYCKFGITKEHSLALTSFQPALMVLFRALDSNPANRYGETGTFDKKACLLGNAAYSFGIS